MKRTITVSGSGRASTVPDVADVRLGVTVTRKSVAEARTSAAETATSILAALTALGVERADIRTASLVVQRRVRLQGWRPAAPRPIGQPPVRGVGPRPREARPGHRRRSGGRCDNPRRGRLPNGRSGAGLRRGAGGRVPGRPGSGHGIGCRGRGRARSRGRDRGGGSDPRSAPLRDRQGRADGRRSGADPGRGRRERGRRRAGGRLSPSPSSCPVSSCTAAVGCPGNRCPAVSRLVPRRPPFRPPPHTTEQPTWHRPRSPCRFPAPGPAGSASAWPVGRSSPRSRAPAFAPRPILGVDASGTAPEHTISVTGTGRVVISPDIADLRLGVMVTKPTVKAARAGRRRVDDQGRRRAQEAGHRRQGHPDHDPVAPAGLRLLDQHQPAAS